MTSRLFRIFWLLVISLVIFSCSKDDDPKVDDDPQNAFRELVLNLVNDYRTSGCDCGTEYYPPVAPISWNETLEQVALDHSTDMETNNYYSHTGLDGSSAADRISRAGYNHSTWGENIARGFHSAESVIEAWIESPAHCKNIMKANFKDMGVGRSGAYWTQVFATHK